VKIDDNEEEVIHDMENLKKKEWNRNAK
jgi:hypothetical protein